MARGRGRGRGKRGKPANQGSRPPSPPKPCAQNVEYNSDSDEMLNQVLRLSQQEYEKSEILSKKENEDIERAINERLQNISTRSDFKPKFQPGLFNPNIVLWENIPSY